MDFCEIMTIITNLLLFILISIVIYKIKNPNFKYYNKYIDLLIVETGAIVYSGLTTLLYWYLQYKTLTIIDLISFISYSFLFLITACTM